MLFPVSLHFAIAKVLGFMKYGFHDQGVDSNTGASKRKVDCTIQRWEQLVPEGRGYGAVEPHFVKLQVGDTRMQGCGT